MKKCPPGVICIENITIIFGLIIIGILLMYIWNPPKGNNQQVVIKEQVKERNENIGENGVYMRCLLYTSPSPRD